MMITLYKTDQQGRLQYYSLHDRQGHLFLQHSFTVTWGPGLNTGREKAYAFDTRREMDQKLQELIRSRLESGYKVLYSFFRNREYESLKPALTRSAAS
jgi:predicted DNA-binding WGR domain protein